MDLETAACLLQVNALGAGIAVAEGHGLWHGGIDGRLAGCYHALALVRVAIGYALRVGYGQMG